MGRVFAGREEKGDASGGKIKSEEMQGKVVKEQLGVERLKPKGSVAKTVQKSRILCKHE